MKKLFFILSIVLISSVSFGQKFTPRYVEPRTNKVILAVDANLPIGDFARSEYQLAPGADQYKQEGNFDLGIGITLGYQIPISSEISFRPNLAIFSFKGRHEVGDFDSPKMTLSGARIAGDLVYFMSKKSTEDIYFLATIGLNMEKLTVKRYILKETFNAQRAFVGVGLGYAFGGNKAYFIEGMVGNTFSGDAPCNESFPSMSIAKLSFGFRF